MVSLHLGHQEATATYDFTLVEWRRPYPSYYRWRHPSTCQDVLLAEGAGPTGNPGAGDAEGHSGGPPAQVTLGPMVTMVTYHPGMGGTCSCWEGDPSPPASRSSGASPLSLVNLHYLQTPLSRTTGTDNSRTGGSMLEWWINTYAPLTEEMVRMLPVF